VPGNQVADALQRVVRCEGRVAGESGDASISIDASALSSRRMGSRGQPRAPAVHRRQRVRYARPGDHSPATNAFALSRILLEEAPPGLMTKRLLDLLKHRIGFTPCRSSHFFTSPSRHLSYSSGFAIWLPRLVRVRGPVIWISKLHRFSEGAVCFAPSRSFAARAGSDGRFCGYDIVLVADRAAKPEALHAGLQPADTDAMLDFDERDLLQAAERAGFTEIHLELRVDIEPRLPPLAWDGFAHSSGNLLIPALARHSSRQGRTSTEGPRYRAGP
jgi:hypothetical protein